MNNVPETATASQLLADLEKEITAILITSQQESDQRGKAELEWSEKYRSLLLDLTDLNDALDRALSSAPSVAGGEEDIFVSNMKMLKRRFAKVFKALDVREIPALGQIADPYLHNVLETEFHEGKAFGEIVKVVVPGYFYQQDVLRVATVIAAGNKTEENRNG